jgi:FKBP-type peptidyl-prolyl cis-trans isomerase
MSLKQSLIFAGLSFCASAIPITPTFGQQDALPEPVATDHAKASYGLGLRTGQDYARGGFDTESFDFEAFVLGMQDALKNAEPKISQEEFAAAMEKMQAITRARFEARQKPLSEMNKKIGADFIAKYKNVEGVQSLPSGILYKVLKSGTGPSPLATDVVKVHYRGRLVDGKEFDSSYKRNEPAVFGLDEVIPGWTQSLSKMKVGEKWQVIIPSELGYGPVGSPPVIGPDAVLVFDIELLGIENSVQQ